MVKFSFTLMSEAVNHYITLKDTFFSVSSWVFEGVLLESGHQFCSHLFFAPIFPPPLALPPLPTPLLPLFSLPSACIPFPALNHTVPGHLPFISQFLGTLNDMFISRAAINSFCKYACF